MDIKYKFIGGVLGKDGAQALRKAVQKDSRLEPIILPRAIIGWLSFIGNYEYEGSLPGIEDSYLEFTKSDGAFNGSIAIGDEIHEFHNSDIYHLASAISVSLGEDVKPIENDLRDLVLVRLGKSIDALAKAQEIARTLDKRLHEKEIDLTKAIAAIPKGKEAGKVYDYSHVLPPEHQKAGYSLTVKPNSFGQFPDETELEASVHHNGELAGQLVGYHNGFKNAIRMDQAQLEPEHKGKGLGQAMYEAVFAHGYHNGAKTIEGSTHSTDASRVHSKLSSKHGFEGYNHKPPASNGTDSGEYDNKFGPYKYTLKQEVSMEKTDLPGRVQAPTKQQGPIGPTAPTKQAKLPRPSTKVALKVPSLKIGKSESERPCEVCDGTQFDNNKFVGCICFRDLAKSIKTTAYSDGFALDFKKDFDKEAFLVLSKYFRS